MPSPESLGLLLLPSGDWGWCKAIYFYGKAQTQRKETEQAGVRGLGKSQSQVKVKGYRASPCTTKRTNQATGNPKDEEAQVAVRKFKKLCAPPLKLRSVIHRAFRLPPGKCSRELGREPRGGSKTRSPFAKGASRPCGSSSSLSLAPLPILQSQSWRRGESDLQDQPPPYPRKNQISTRGNRSDRARLIPWRRRLRVAR